MSTANIKISQLPELSTMIGNAVMPVVANGVTQKITGTNLAQFFNAGGPPGGANTQVQFNDGGSFGGAANLTFNKTSNVFTVPGNIVPAGNSTASLGSSTHQWKDLYVSNSTIYMNNVPVTLTSGNVLTVAGNSVVTASNGSANIGNFVVNNNTFENSYGGSFDNGTSGTGATARLSLPAASANNSVMLENYYGNVTIGTGTSGSATSSWVFDTNGALNLTNFGVVRQSGPVNVVATDYSQLQWVDSGNINIADPNDSSGPKNWAYVESGGFFVETNINVGNTQSWSFNTNGQLTMPGSGYVENPPNSSLDPLNPNVSTMVLRPDANYSQALVLDPTAPGHIHLRAPTFSGNIDEPGANIFLGGELSSFEVGYASGTAANVFVHSNGNTWTFDNTGNLTAAGNVISPSNFVGTSLRPNLTDFNWSESITGIATGATTVVTLANNVFGDPWSGQVTITGVTGTTEANATWWYEAVDSNQFQLYTDSTLSTPVNSSAWGAYVSGGFAVTLDYANIEINAQNITIRSDHGDYNNKIWTFNRAGQTVFPYQDVARGDNPSGNITGYAMVMGDGTGEAIISTPDGNINGTWSAQRLVINPGKGGDGTSGEGGDIYLWAGRGGDQDGSGGDIKIRGGQGGAGVGAGGYIRIEGGDGNGSGGPAGFIEITGGVGGVGQNGGYVRIQGGQGQDSGGDANIVGGVGQSGPGGPVNIVGGVSANGLSEYGNVNITSGASTWTFDNGGTLTTPGNITVANVVTANTFVSNAFNVVTAGNLSITSQYGLGFTGTILEDNGTLELIGSGGGGVVVGWDSTYGNGLGNIATVNFNEVGGEGILLRTGNRAATEYNWNFDNTGNLTLPGNTFSVNYANGTPVSLGSGSYGNADVSNFLANYGSNTIVTTGNITGNTAGYAIGYRDIPQVTFSANATAALTDAGKHYYSTTAGNLALTLPDNSNVAFDTGATLNVVVLAAGNVLVNQGTGVTLYMAGSSTTGNRVVGAYGMATVMKVAANTWVINGTGVY